jgi:hypothetical protein
VAESTLQRSPGSSQAAPADETGGARGSRSWRDPEGRRYLIRAAAPAVIISVVLLVISTGLVLWARTRPGFDPYGWLTWGQQTIHGSLDTNAAPSWKPLPFLFTVPYALFGHYQLWLWMITAVAVALAGVVFAARIAYRLVLEGSDRRWPAYVAGAVAGIGVLMISDYWHYILSAQSDPMIVSLCLGAVDCHLSGRRRWAFVFGCLAALGRPEAWPFIAVYAIWCWRAVPEMRWLIVAGAVVVLGLWFGVPAATSRSAFVAANNALGSGRALHNDKVFGTVQRFIDLQTTVLCLVALASVIYAAFRRDWVTIALAVITVAWVIVEIAFALHGWPGLPRYMFEAAGFLVVIAAVGVGRLLTDSWRFGAVAGWAAVGVAAVIVVLLIPPVVNRARSEHADIVAQRVRTKEINRLHGTVVGLGGAARLRACGEPLTRLEYQTMLAWTLGVNVAKVGFKYSQAIAHGNPIVLFTPESEGWKVQAMHQVAASCQSLPS